MNPETKSKQEQEYSLLNKAYLRAMAEFVLKYGYNPIPAITAMQTGIFPYIFFEKADGEIKKIAQKILQDVDKN